MVATNNVHYATPRDFPRASVLAAIRARQSLEEMEGWQSASPLAHLRSDAEQRRRFARWPGVVDAAGELVARTGLRPASGGAEPCRRSIPPTATTSSRT